MGDLIDLDKFRLVELRRILRLRDDGKTTEFNQAARDRLATKGELLKEYLELPIAVQHFWEGYNVVDQALLQLEQGWFMDASLLCDACFTDDRVLGVLNTRVNSIFALPMEFKWQGQDDHQDEDGQTQAIVELKELIVKVTKKYWEEMVPSSAIREFTRWGVMINVGVGEIVWRWETMDLTEEKPPPPAPNSLPPPQAPSGFLPTNKNAQAPARPPGGKVKLTALAAMGIDPEQDLLLPTMKTWNPQFVYWRWDTRSFWLIHQGGQVELHPGDGTWMLYSPTGHNHGWLYGTIRALGKLWLDRVYTYRDWARAEEKLSLGIIKATEPANANPDDKIRFEAMMADLPPEATVILPTTTQGTAFNVEMMQTDQVGTGWEIFVKRIEKLDSAISVLLLGQNMTTEIPRGAGSRAAAMVHDSVRQEILRADVTGLSSMLKKQFLAPFVERNWGAAAQKLGVDWKELVPEVTWNVEPPDDKVAGSKALVDFSTSLAQFQLAMAPVDMKALMEKYEIPVLEESETTQWPPPGMVNERPRLKVVNESQPDPDSRDTEPTGLTILARSHKSRIKKGGLQGQVYIDSLVETGRDMATEAIAKYKDEILAICRAPTSYTEKRHALRALYADTDATEFRKIVQRVLVKSNFAGRLSMKVDTRGR
jgi:phage gp29-like protein